jgi:hypothetical protein
MPKYVTYYRGGNIGEIRDAFLDEYLKKRGQTFAKYLIECIDKTMIEENGKR